MVRGSALLGGLFSVLSVVAGVRVLTGVGRPDYVVLPWLVRYNVAAGMVGVVAAMGLWTVRTWAVRLARALAGLHGTVWLLLVAWLATGEPVATDSLVAMLLRTGVWVAIAIVTRRALVSKAV